MSKRFDIEERKNFLRVIKDLMKKGYNQTQAIKEAGISQTAFYRFKRSEKLELVEQDNIKSEKENYKKMVQNLQNDNTRLTVLLNKAENKILKLQEILGKILIEKELNES